jgi:hypothetical protein
MVDRTLEQLLQAMQLEVFKFIEKMTDLELAEYIEKISFEEIDENYKTLMSKIEAKLKKIERVKEMKEVKEMQFK